MPKGPRMVTGSAVGIDASATGTALVAIGMDGALLAETLIASKRFGPERLSDIAQGVHAFLRVVCPMFVFDGHVCMEDYAFNPRTASQSHTLGEVGGIVKLRLYNAAHIYPTLVTNNQAKKFCLGKGGGKVKITKAMLLKGVFKKWDYDVNDDNLADAYIQARIARAIMLQKTDFSYEAEVLASVMPRLHTEAPAQVRENAYKSLSYA